MSNNLAAKFWRAQHKFVLDRANEYIALMELEVERLVRLRESDTWLESALLQLLHENGIEPSSSMLINAFERSKGSDND